MRIQDVYKLLFQGSLGPYHIMLHLDYAFSELEREFNEIETTDSKKETLLETISINRHVVRVNLRPFKGRFDSINSLFTVIRQSTATFTPDREELLRLWNIFSTLVSENELDFDHQELTEFEKSIDPLNDTSIRHSREYREREKPSYRVVLKSIFSDFFPGSSAWERFR
jgi:hypothetical protein